MGDLHTIVYMRLGWIYNTVGYGDVKKKVVKVELKS